MDEQTNFVTFLEQCLKDSTLEPDQYARACWVYRRLALSKYERLDASPSWFIR